MNIVVIGANGQLGMDISHVLEADDVEVIRFTHDNMDIADPDAVRKELSTLNPEVVINTAAYHHVDKCEANPQLAFEVNALGARNLATVTRDLNTLLVHISTDYVFDGRKNQPYEEEDTALPLNVYGNTKLSGELFIQSIAERYQILRTSGLYGKNPCRAKGHNFVELMLKLAGERDEIRVVNDEILTPTSTLEVARQIRTLIKKDVYGLFHATAEGECSWYEFARAIFQIKGIDINLQIADPSEFPVKTPRPKYSALENKKLKAAGCNGFKHWKDGLAEYLSTSN